MTGPRNKLISILHSLVLKRVVGEIKASIAEEIKTLIEGENIKNTKI